VYLQAEAFILQTRTGSLLSDPYDLCSWVKIKLKKLPASSCGYKFLREGSTVLTMKHCLQSQFRVLISMLIDLSFSPY
jgi:hypothetical protein